MSARLANHALVKSVGDWSGALDEGFEGAHGRGVVVVGAAAMEATGVYWEAPWDALTEAGVEVEDGSSHRVPGMRSFQLCKSCCTHTRRSWRSARIADAWSFADRQATGAPSVRARRGARW